MKLMNDDGNSCNNEINNNWLGFSMSDPHQPQQHQVSATPAATNFFLAPHLFNTTSGLCYGFENSPFSVLPLKSDGSLCVMEAISRSHHQGGMVPNHSPKLEDFLGMEPHDPYGTHENEAMVLSLDSMFYHQPHDAPRHHQYFTGIGEIYQDAAKEVEEEADGSHFLECDTSSNSSHMRSMVSFKNWAIGGQNPPMETLTLSMSPGSQSSGATAPAQITAANPSMELAKKRGSSKIGPKQALHRKSLDTFGQRTSQYRGVTRHRWTGRYEAHLWDNSCKKEGQTRKGRQVYLGGYDMEEKAARAYDLAALKYWGSSTHINFGLENYKDELDDMTNMSRQEYVAHLRRKSSGFSRGASMYRGVTRHHQHGRWQARIGRVAGNKDLYLGTFSTQEEAAEAYDVAAIKFRGVNAVTNFDISKYDVERIMASNSLPSGNLVRRQKDIEPEPLRVESIEPLNTMEEEQIRSSENINWKMALYESNPNQCVDSNTFPTTHFSNPSSLVTSLSSSRECSPDKPCSGSVFEYKFNDSSGSAPVSNSWISSSGQMRPFSVSQFPVFATWNDA